MADESSEEMKSGNPGDGATNAPKPPAMPQTIAAEDLQPMYANFVRVGGSPEELVLDFGLNPNPMGTPNVPVNISERIVLNYFTAKRLWMALSMALQRHEQAFGVLEVDVNKRAVSQGQRPAAR